MSPLMHSLPCNTYTLVVRLYCTGNFLQNVLSCYPGTTQDFETNNTSYERPITELLELVMKEGVAVSSELPYPLE